MGSPISSIKSEIFLQHLEMQYIENIKNQFNIKFYGRYVDDIFILYDNKSDNSDNILNEFNNIHPSMKFTLEKQINCSLNFLDLTVRKIKANKKYN